MSFWDDASAAFAAAGRGAATVYHDVLATGAHITAWEHDPAVAPLLHIGVQYAAGALARFGVPVDAIEILAPDILAALKALAALDATVPSVAGVPPP